MKNLKILVPFILMFLVVLTLGCAKISLLKMNKTAEITPKEMNGSQIQAEFEAEYSNVKSAIDSGDLEKAKEHYSLLLEAYHDAKEFVGPEHLTYFVSEEKLRSLKLQLNSGDLVSARATVSEIGGKCGFEFCHKRVGSSMVNMEIEYTIIKNAINEGDLSRARSHFPAFKQFFNETREKVSTFMPEEAQTRMKKEYIDNLEIALEQNDVEGAKLAIETISNTTCSFAGCHKIFFTNRTLWKFY